MPRSDVAVATALSSRHRRPLGVVLGLMVLLLSRGAVAAEPLLDPTVVGPDLPPQGQSLFDQLLGTGPASPSDQSVPIAFPFEALLEQLRQRVGADAQTADPFTAVLIPVGRSLQRHAAAPAFFASPRVVVAATGDGTDARAVPLRSRLFIGYQEQAGVLEIISYNAALGRFEFQVVKDYTASGTPQVYYAKRMICMACHQNQAPIFSRPLWSETQANADIARHLRHAANDADGARYAGIPLNVSIDTPAAIDAATDAANRLALWQRLWIEGCDELGGAARECRLYLLDAALKLRLSGWRPRAAAAPDTLQALRKALAQRWPDGIAVPSADIPNRDPMAAARTPVYSGHGVAVPASFDPLVPRLPVEVHAFRPDNGGDSPDGLAPLVQGLAEQFSAAQIAWLDARLLAAGGAESDVVHQVTCQLRQRLDAQHNGRIDLHCPAGSAVGMAARLYFTAGRFQRGHIDRLQLGDEILVDIHLKIPPGQTVTVDAHILRLLPTAADGSARRASGQLLSALELRGPLTQLHNSRVILRERDDYVLIRRALNDLLGRDGAADVLAARPFDAAAMVSALAMGLGERDRVPTATRAFTPRLEPHAPMQADPAQAPTAGMAGILATLQRYCAACHASAERFPPNFLSGDFATIKENLARCAPRIDVRLAMWSLPPDERAKSPMPPALTVADADSLAADPAWRRLREFISTLRAEQARAGADAEVDDYEALEPCLGEGG